MNVFALSHAPAANDRQVRMSAPRHIPVMVEEVLQYLLHDHSHLVVDGTVGFGGHAEAILEARAGVTLLGIDRDPVALAAASERLAAFGNRVRLVPGVFSNLPGVLGDQ